MQLDPYATLHQEYRIKRKQIRQRLREFRSVLNHADDKEVFEELAFCILTAGASAAMGLKSIESTKDVLHTCSLETLRKRLRGVHRYPNSRAAYIIHTREHLSNECKLNLKQILKREKDPIHRRDLLAKNKDIKGIGYKEASHFLRNIGFRGYAIIDKHILNSMLNYGLITNTKPPTGRLRYLELESTLKSFASSININIDELDLLLWSGKTGKILK